MHSIIPRAFRASIEGALEVRAEPPSGLLLPKEIHAVEVEVRTLATPCVAQVLLPCQLVQYSDALLHQLTEERHLEAQRRIDEFMLDEPRGAKRPVSSAPTLSHRSPTQRCRPTRFAWFPSRPSCLPRWR